MFSFFGKPSKRGYGEKVLRRELLVNNVWFDVKTGVRTGTYDPSEHEQPEESQERSERHHRRHKHHREEYEHNSSDSPRADEYGRKRHSRKYSEEHSHRRHSRHHSNRAETGKSEGYDNKDRRSRPQRDASDIRREQRRSEEQRGRRCHRVDREDDVGERVYGRRPDDDRGRRAQRSPEALSPQAPRSDRRRYHRYRRQSRDDSEEFGRPHARSAGIRTETDLARPQRSKELHDDGSRDGLGFTSSRGTEVSPESVVTYLPHRPRSEKLHGGALSDAVASESVPEINARPAPIVERQDGEAPGALQEPRDNGESQEPDVLPIKREATDSADLKERKDDKPDNGDIFEVDPTPAIVSPKVDDTQQVESIGEPERGQDDPEPRDGPESGKNEDEKLTSCTGEGAMDDVPATTDASVTKADTTKADAAPIEQPSAIQMARQPESWGFGSC